MRDTSEPGRTGHLFEAFAPRLLAYARRHGDAAEADDLVAEAFCTALRREAVLPADDQDAWVWLVATVRRLAANSRRRRHTREEHWAETVRRYWHTDADRPADEQVAERDAALGALAELGERDRELLLLVAWEGLTPTQAAEVLGVRPNTAAARISRARRRLSDLTHPTAPVAVRPRRTEA